VVIVEDLIFRNDGWWAYEQKQLLHNFMSTRTAGRPKKNRRKDDNEEPIGGRQG